MSRPSDAELIEELKLRFQENEKALHDLRVLTRKLEDVNKKLQESEALKTNFLSNIRNEINNPLTSIMGLSKQLISDNTSENVSAVASMIYAESYELDFQLRNIFIAAELEAGESSPSISLVDVSSLVNHISYSLSHRASVKGVKLNVFNSLDSEDDGGNLFKTDSEKLQLIIVNLITNAIEFSPGESDVNLKISKADNVIILTVEDFGEGISRDDQKNIFDRFKQLDMGMRKSHRGHGLGLSLTKALIEILDGTISLDSEVGKGTIFTVSLPEAAVNEDVDVYSEEGNEFIFEEEGKEETF